MTESRSEYFKNRREQRKNTHKRVEISLTMDEYRAFEKIAYKEDISVSKVISNMAIAYRDTRYFVPKEVTESLSEFSRIIRGIANNINQIARTSNTFQNIDQNVLFQHLKSLDDKVQDYVKGKL